MNALLSNGRRSAAVLMLSLCMLVFAAPARADLAAFDPPQTDAAAPWSLVLLAVVGCAMLSLESCLWLGLRRSPQLRRFSMAAVPLLFAAALLAYWSVG